MLSISNPPPQIWSVANLFSAPNSPQRPPCERDDLALAPARRVTPPPPPSGPSAWMYINVLVTQSQVGGITAGRLTLPAAGAVSMSRQRRGSDRHEERPAFLVAHPC